MRSLIWPAVVLFVGCDSQVDGDYQGEPIATLAGVVDNQRTIGMAGPTVDIVYVADLVGVESVPVEGDFPAAFHLSIFEPPDDEQLWDVGGTRIAFAFVMSANAGTDYTDFAMFRTDVLGGDERHLLAYVETDVPEGSAASYFLHGTPTAGFHVLDVQRLSSEEAMRRITCRDALGPEADPIAVFQQCGGYELGDWSVAAADLATELQLRLVDDPETLELPFTWRFSIEPPL